MEINNSFPFKVDPSNLPKLTSRGDNYAEWCAVWTVALEFADPWDVVSGVIKKPATNPGEPATVEHILYSKSCPIKIL